MTEVEEEQYMIACMQYFNKDKLLHIVIYCI